MIHTTWWYYVITQKKLGLGRSVELKCLKLSNNSTKRYVISTYIDIIPGPGRHTAREKEKEKERKQIYIYIVI